MLFNKRGGFENMVNNTNYYKSKAQYAIPNMYSNHYYSGFVQRNEKSPDLLAEVAPKYELRGVWVTTVRNNDFPSTEVFANEKFDIDLFKQEYLAIIQHCKQLRLNAIFLQVRPEGDAFYPSKLNPWSQYLTGQQGIEPDWEGFDPLSWMIEVTHLEGIEFHAWFNPYRLTPSIQKGASKEELLQQLSPDHYARNHPEWVYFFNGQLYLNPGVPEVNRHMNLTVREVLENYKVDAIHLDDFFYPYTYQTLVDDQWVFVTFNEESPDYETFLQYRQGNQSIAEWRENNINQLVYGLSNTVHQYNKEFEKSVAFGISPFGIWASAEETGGVGSQTSPNQLSSLDEYANTKLWVDSGWIDYIIPQNYWSFNDRLSPFAAVADWWNQVVATSETQLYMGLGLYLYEEDAENPSWQNPDEMAAQIRYIRTLSNNKGYVFFTYHNLLPGRDQSPVLEQANVLIEELQQDFSLVPPRPTLQTSPTQPIANLTVSRHKNEINLLTFTDSTESNSQYYVIYRVAGIHPEGIDTTNPQNILNVVGKVRDKVEQSYADDQINLTNAYTYGVAALSQAQVESSVVTIVFNP